MGKFRKFLLVAFAGVCALLLWHAIDSCEKEPSHFQHTGFLVKKKYPNNERPWGRSLEYEARQNNKMVFFTTPNVKFTPDPALREFLSKYFLITVLDERQSPADIRILDGIFRMVSKKPDYVVAGILTPRLRPIYLTSNITHKDTPETPSIASAIYAAAKQYFLATDELRKKASKLPDIFDQAKKIRDEKFESENIESFKCTETELEDLYKFFKNPKREKSPPGILSENARLLAHLHKIFPTNKVAQLASKEAEKLLIKRFSDSKISKLRKIFFARAMIELAETSNSKILDTTVKGLLDKIISTSLPDGRIADEGKECLISTHAITAQLLAAAYQRYGNNNYKIFAEKLCDYLEIVLKSYGQIPCLASMGRNSQGSSVTYALTIGAFAKVHKITKKKKFLLAARLTLDEWNKLYMTKENVWSLNAATSPLANYTRPIVFEDGEYCSYVGEAAQAFSYLSIADNTFDSPYAEKLNKIYNAAARLTNIRNQAMGSLKLSMLPLLEEDDLKLEE